MVIHMLVYTGIVYSCYADVVSVHIYISVSDALVAVVTVSLSSIDCVYH